MIRICIHFPIHRPWNGLILSKETLSVRYHPCHTTTHRIHSINYVFYVLPRIDGSRSSRICVKSISGMRVFSPINWKRAEVSRPREQSRFFRSSLSSPLQENNDNCEQNYQSISRQCEELIANNHQLEQTVNNGQQRIQTLENIKAQVKQILAFKTRDGVL